MSETAPSRKSPDAFRTISEVADDLRLPQHVLRFWETRFAQIKPVKRAGGRRFYRPEDVALLRSIKALLYGDGYTIRGVQRMLQERGPRVVAAAPAPTAAPEDDPPALAPVLDAAEPGSRGEGDGRAAIASRLEALLRDLAHCEGVLAAARQPRR